MSDLYYFRKDCRLCNRTNMELVLPLTPTALCDAYLKEPQDQAVFPLDLYLCKDCGHIQIDCVIDPEYIYRDYLYVTTSSSGLDNHFHEYAGDVVNLFKLKQGSLVVDIGSNEGALLKHFQTIDMRVVGVEPAADIAEAATLSGIPTYPSFFNAAMAETIVNEHGRADMVTINNLFANIDDLGTFAQALTGLLAPEGILVIEAAYLPDMLNNMVFDFIYHEHLSCFSIAPLKKFFNAYGLKLINLQHIENKGGSMRYYFARRSSGHIESPAIDTFLKKEQDDQVHQKNAFEKFAARIDNCRQTLRDCLSKKSNATIVGYGASATSTTLIYHFGLQDYLTFLVDDNPAKIGTYSPGLHIPVKDASELNTLKPDYIVVLAWRFADQIIKKHPHFKGRFIIPLPELKSR